MRNKKRITTVSIIVFILLIGIGLVVLQYNRYSGRTLGSRELILHRSNNGTIIVSEIPIDNYIISEIINQRGQYGYALFEPIGKKNYKLQTKVWREKDSIIADIILMDEKFYEIFMCNRSDLDYAEVSYIDNTTNVEFAIKKLKLIEGRIAITETPGLKSYTRNVVFYDVNGNQYE